MKAHEAILRELLGKLPEEKIKTILDAGSGRTSLSCICEAFPSSEVDCVVFPGDERKKTSIQESLTDRHCNLLELDLCKNIPEKQYNLAVAHLLLGEAVKFGNSFIELLNSLMSIQAKNLIIIDYYEDPDADTDKIKKAAGLYNYKLTAELLRENDNPQVWDTFIGFHNFGILLEKTYLLSKKTF